MFTKIKALKGAFDTGFQYMLVGVKLNAVFTPIPPFYYTISARFLTSKVYFKRKLENYLVNFVNALVLLSRNEILVNLTNKMTQIFNNFTCKPVNCIYIFYMY